MRRYFLAFLFLILFCLGLYGVYWWSMGKKQKNFPKIEIMISNTSEGSFKIYGRVTEIDQSKGTFTIKGIRSDGKMGEVKIRIAKDEAYFWSDFAVDKNLPSDAGMECKSVTPEMKNPNAGFKKRLDVSDRCKGPFSIK